MFKNPISLIPLVSLVREAICTVQHTLEIYCLNNSEIYALLQYVLNLDVSTRSSFILKAQPNITTSAVYLTLVSMPTNLCTTRLLAFIH